MFIGKAAALGLVIKIPILIRSLADSLSITTSGPSLRFHEGFLTLLDNGLPANDPCALVPTYACDWWNEDAEPEADQIMSFQNLARLLTRHQSHHPISDLRPQTVLRNTDSATASALSLPELVCGRCREYRDLAAQALDKVAGVLQYAEAMEVSGEASRVADLRRAQGYFLLNEGVQQKEMHEKGTAPVWPPKQHKGLVKIDGINVNRKLQRILAMASAELERLQNLPPGSHKWTWGPQLTEAEAIGLLPAYEPVPPHSGYDVSLPTGGFMPFPSSPRPSMPNLSTNQPLSIQDEIPPLPEANVAIDCLSLTGKFSAAEPESEQEEAIADREAEAGDVTDTSDSVPDLAALWTKPANTAPPHDAEADSDNSVKNLAALWSRPANNVALHDDEADSDGSVGDLASLWSKPAYSAAPNDASPASNDIDATESNKSITDLASLWCGSREVRVSEDCNDADNENANTGEVAALNKPGAESGYRSDGDTRSLASQMALNASGKRGSDLERPRLL